MNQPDREGFYWYRHSDQHQWAIMEVFRKDGTGFLRCRNRTDDSNYPENYTGEWSLITPPSEGADSDEGPQLPPPPPKGTPIKARITGYKTAEVYPVEDDGEPDPSAALAEALESLEHTRYWYGCRLERLSQFMREEATPEIRHRYFSIIANGTADHAEPPTYAQQMNTLKHDAERLAEALEIGVKWMDWWTSQYMCECEDGHICGKAQRIAELTKMRAALALHRKN
jgi:hypothetical protein